MALAYRTHKSIRPHPMAYSRSMASAGIHHPMQKRHQHQMRGNFVIGVTAQQRLGMLPPEGKKCVEQLVGIKAAAGFENSGSV
jgi:hypothetical protein